MDPPSDIQPCKFSSSFLLQLLCWVSAPPLLSLSLSFFVHISSYTRSCWILFSLSSKFAVVSIRRWDPQTHLQTRRNEQNQMQTQQTRGHKRSVYNRPEPYISCCMSWLLTWYFRSYLGRKNTILGLISVETGQLRSAVLLVPFSTFFRIIDYDFLMRVCVVTGVVGVVGRRVLRRHKGVTVIGRLGTTCFASSDWMTVWLLLCLFVSGWFDGKGPRQRGDNRSRGWPSVDDRRCLGITVITWPWSTGRRNIFYSSISYLQLLSMGGPFTYCMAHEWTIDRFRTKSYLYLRLFEFRAPLYSSPWHLVFFGSVPGSSQTVSIVLLNLYQ